MCGGGCASPVSSRDPWAVPLVESVGKKTLRNLGVLGVSAVSLFLGGIPPQRRRVSRGYAENNISPTDSGSGLSPLCDAVICRYLHQLLADRRHPPLIELHRYLYATGRARTTATAQAVLTANRRGIATASHQVAKPCRFLRDFCGTGIKWH